jgi:hypothetical protein
MRRFFRLRHLLSALLSAAITATSLSAQTLDVIRGRITGPEGEPLMNVTVKASGYSGNVTKTTRSDKNGRYSITYTNGEGDYWLEFSAIGFVKKRFEIKRIADEEVLIADTKLASSIATLDALNVTADGPRALANRNAGTASVGGNETTLNKNSVSPDQMGNLAALAAGLPGIQLIPGLDGAADVFSALGLSSDQNSTTFNGLGSAVSVLPSDAQVTATVVTSSFDPAVGSFSGGRISVSTQPGSNFSNRQASSNAITPPLEFADDVAEAQNKKYSNYSLGFGGRGPIKMDQHFYNTSAQFSRRFNDLPSLLNTSALGLSSAGVARDSVSRLLGILSTLNIPSSLAGAPTQQITDQYLAQGNIDVTPSSNGAGNGFTFGYVGNYSKSQQVIGGGGGQIGGGGGPGGGLGTFGGGNSAILTVPAHNGESQSWTGQLTAKHSAYIWESFLSTTNLGVSVSGQENSPYLRTPSGTVRINSLLDDGSAAVRTLSFGGNPSLSNSRSINGELSNEIRWYAGNNRHAIKLTSNVHTEQSSAEQSTNLYGAYTYNSLADLQAGLPASYTRTLYAPRINGNQLTGAVSLGDSWRPNTTVQVQYGLRADANRFVTSPVANSLLEQRLGVRNDVVPNRVVVSPRIGFSWFYGNQDQVAFVPGAARPPRAVIQGGVGLFQNVRGADLISGAVNSTGLPSSTRQISCVGPATPTPDWNAYAVNVAAIPTTCADGSSGTQFSNATPNVTLFAKDYAQSQSWRTSLSWSGPILDNRFALGVSTVYSLNLHQPDAVDRNFSDVQRFTLANEGDRPVFANVGAIDPRTGTIAVTDTRRTTDFLRVAEQRSDLRSDTRQLYLTLKPVTANPKLKWNVSYQLLATRDQYRGFSSTAGDPFERQWGQGLQQGRHSIGFGFSSIPVFDVVYVTWNVAFQSGARYTPSISGDVNGDGSGNNDRAFVFDPSTITDPTFKAAMTSLMTSGDASARACLQRQLGTLATRGSCQSPWTASSSLSFSFNPQKIGLPKRASVNFTVNNPLGLADLLVHGQDIHGWGQSIAPDASLLLVRGFDPTTRRYTYEVNQRFGSTRPTQSTNRQIPLISLRVQLDIGSPRERQVLTQRLDAGRGREGTKLTAPNLKSLGSSTIPNPMALILQQTDSLKLTRQQADSLSSLSRLFTQRADALWTPVSVKLEALPEKYDQDRAYDEYVTAREKTVDYLITLVPHVKRLLTASQKRKLPLQLSNYLDERVLKFLRSSSSGDGGAFFIR